MKRILFVSMICMYCHGMYAQTVLNASTSLPRAGDRVCKQEIGYLSPGEDGAGRVWQFDRLTPIKELCELIYTGNDSLLNGMEHRTRYTYWINQDSLWKTGVENRTTFQKALYPELLAVYPMQLGNQFSFFEYTGEYQHAYGMELLGRTSVKVDTLGTLIIAGDTLSDVLRVHTCWWFV